MSLSGNGGAIAPADGAGSDLIVDEVLTDGELGSYATLLAPFRVHVVGVHASLEELEARERARGDRLPGLARWQFPRVHVRMRYDLEVDTGHMSASECADAIQTRLGL